MKNNKKIFKVGDMVTVYNRYLFAVPVRGIVKDISSHDGALSIMFNHDENKNVRKHDKGYFFPEECRLYVVKKQATTKENKGMTIEDFEKLKHGALLKKKNSPDGSIRVFLGMVNGDMVTCREDSSTPHRWTPSELGQFSIYEPPKEKVKLYLYVMSCGRTTSEFFTDDFKKRWKGVRMENNPVVSNTNKWVKTNCFIEVEI